jgi:DNA-binding response OmpR family regulator
MKAVLIDDNAVDSRLLRELFAVHGHQLISLSSPAGALEEIAAERPDLVLVDLHLPIKDGLALVRDLRAQSSTSTVPVVAITAYPARYTSKEIHDSGCDACLIKPLNTREVLAQLIRLCSTSSS